MGSRLVYSKALMDRPSAAPVGRRGEGERYGGGSEEGGRPGDELLGLRLQQLLLRSGRRPPEPAGPVQRLVQGGPAGGVLPLLRAPHQRTHDPSDACATARRARSTTSSTWRPTTTSASRIGPRWWRPRSRPRAAMASARRARPSSPAPSRSTASSRPRSRPSRTRKPPSCSRPGTAPTSASSPPSCAPGTPSSSTSIRTPRSWTGPSWPSPRPSSSVTTTPSTWSASSPGSRARSSWWWKASTRWTGTCACCPRSSRWRSATAPAS